MAYDINLQRAAKAARLAAGEPKYADLSPTEPTAEDDAKVLRERNAVFFTGEVPVLPPVVTDVPEPIAPPPADSGLPMPEVSQAPVEASDAV